MTYFQDARQLDDVIANFNSGLALVCAAILRECPQLAAILLKFDEQVRDRCDAAICAASADVAGATESERKCVRDVSDKNRARVNVVRHDVMRLMTSAQIIASKVRASIMW